MRSLMIKYLGELDDDDMVMFVVEHLKDHKPPSKIVEGLEPVRLSLLLLVRLVLAIRLTEKKICSFSRFFLRKQLSSRYLCGAKSCLRALLTVKDLRQTT